MEHKVATLEHESGTLEHKSGTLEHESYTLEHKSVSLEHKSVSLEHEVDTLGHKSGTFVTYRTIYHIKVGHPAFPALLVKDNSVSLSRLSPDFSYKIKMRRLAFLLY